MARNDFAVVKFELDCWIFNMQLLKSIFAKQAFSLSKHSDKSINNAVCSNVSAP